MADAPALDAPLVDAQWLHANLDEVRVVDVRWYLDGRSGLDAYFSGHIPGAVWADIDHDLSGPGGPVSGRHPLPTPERFASAMSSLGIANDDTVVAYDDASDSVAARLWWMLDAIGVRVAVLDGGLASWTYGLSFEPATPHMVRFTPRPWPASRLADADDVDEARQHGICARRALGRALHRRGSGDRRASRPHSRHAQRTVGRQPRPDQRGLAPFRPRNCTSVTRRSASRG